MCGGLGVVLGRHQGGHDELGVVERGVVHAEDHRAGGRVALPVLHWLMAQLAKPHRETILNSS